MLAFSLALCVGFTAVQFFKKVEEKGGKKKTPAICALSGKPVVGKVVSLRIVEYIGQACRPINVDMAMISTLGEQAKVTNRDIVQIAYDNTLELILLKDQLTEPAKKFMELLYERLVAIDAKGVRNTVGRISNFLPKENR
ncbi:hypothetical protein KKA94_02295 [Patescibacteria group bacterium]|nr:hypothetical protein [Patescibacteria group bacterium]